VCTIFPLEVLEVDARSRCGRSGRSREAGPFFKLSFLRSSRQNSYRVLVSHRDSATKNTPDQTHVLVIVRHTGVRAHQESSRNNPIRLRSRANVRAGVGTDGSVLGEGRVEGGWGGGDLIEFLLGLGGAVLGTPVLVPSHRTASGLVREVREGGTIDVMIAHGKIAHGKLAHGIHW